MATKRSRLDLESGPGTAEGNLRSSAATAERTIKQRLIDKKQQEDATPMVQRAGWIMLGDDEMRLVSLFDVAVQ